MAFIKEEGVINSVTLVFLVSQAVTRPNVKSRNLWCLFAKSSWNVNVLKILCICCCSLSRKYIAFLRFWTEHLIWSEYCILTKKAITSFMKCVDVATFSWAVSKIVLVLNFYFAICDTRWSSCNFPSIFVFFKTREMNCRAVLLSEASSETKYLQAKQRTRQRARITSLVGK